ncbi:arginine N-methyltransferas-like protein [Trichodelitschia bisporula]|uniref:Protein arginine N-methyltransferase n=1 Tax=Trichodelitschia bisporula TaxID=703511 RepID=A0A6G1I0B4_9PEZI|nr:arginine N-methyltransferas-like protein [Trichodelitschia bisporula]
MDSSQSNQDPAPVWYVGHHHSRRSSPFSDASLDAARRVDYDMLTIPITTPAFQAKVAGMIADYLDLQEQGASADELPVPIVPALTPADTELAPLECITQYIAVTSSWIDLASADPVIANVSRQVFSLEVAYAAFCGVQNIMIPGPAVEGRVLTSRLAQYARCILEALRSGPYMQFHILLPMTPSPIFAQTPGLNLSQFAKLPNHADAEDYVSSSDAWSTWETWNLIRTVCSYNTRLSVALGLPKQLPSPAIQSRWFSEPLRLLLIHETSFITNKHSQPVLHKGYRHLLTRYMRLKTAPWILLWDVGPVQKDPSADDPTSTSQTWPLPSDLAKPKSVRLDPNPHLSYMRYLQRNQPPLPALLRFGAGYQDYLQAPLQPLADNLESITYEVFEKDPVKYDWYERAVHAALTDWAKLRKPTSSLTRPGAVVIAVVGAGRGPLVTRALLAAEATGVPVEMWAVEKNPNAYVHLQRRNADTWSSSVTVIKSDMRSWRGPLSPDGKLGKVDILISELLGSFADNELSPECLDGVQHVLAPAGISIPASYTAHLTPLATPRIYADILGKGRDDATAFEVPYVVMLHAYDFLSVPAADDTDRFLQPDVQTAWKFEHPVPRDVIKQAALRRGGSAAGGGGGVSGGDGANEHNARFAALRFAARERGVCHGLGGYFETVLYGDVELSTNPVTMEGKSADMISWFPIFFPVKTPITFPDNSELLVSIWRHTDDRKVWYEWMIETFTKVGGRMVKINTSELHSSIKNGCLM